ncbi:MAG: hypothetical protein NZZ60_04940 [Bacteroidia bacterium]|nr:hypothetical protein [Bacteroidia bacterium]
MARLIQERGGTVDLSKYTFEIDGKKFELMDGILPDSLLSDFYYDARGLTWSEALLYKTSKGKFIEVRGTSSFGMFRFVNALLYQGAPYYGVSGSGPVFVSPKGYVVSMPEIEFLPANILVIDLGDGQARTINAADSLSRARIIDSNEGKVVRSVTPAAVYHVKGKDKACIVEYKEKLNPSDQEQNIPQSSYLLIRWK